MMPHFTPTDEAVLIEKVARLRAGLPDPPMYGTVMPAYPSLIPELVHLIPDRSHSEPGVAHGLAEHARRATVHQLDVRAVSALLSTLIVPGTYLLARLFLRRSWSLFAAALMGTSLVHVSLSQMARPHGIAGATMLLAVMAAVYVRRRGSVLSYALAGIAAGLAVGTLQSGVAVFLPLVVALLLRKRRPDRASGWWFLVTCVLFGALTAWFQPGALGSRVSPEGVHDGRSHVVFDGHGLWIHKFDGTGFLRVLGTLYSYEPALLVLAVLGIVAAAATCVRGETKLASDTRRDLLVVLAFAGPYLLVIGAFAATYERFVIPLIPYLACLGAFGLSSLLATLQSASVRAGAGVAASVVFLGFTTFVAWKLGSVRSAPDTLAEAAAWIERHVDAESERIHVMPYLGLPLLYSEESLKHNWSYSHKDDWLEYQNELRPDEISGPRYHVFLPLSGQRMLTELADDPIAYFRRQRADYVVIQQVGARFKIEALPDTRSALSGQAELVRRFSPMRVDRGDSYRMDSTYQKRVLARPFFQHLLEARCMGPTVELYRLAESP